MNLTIKQFREKFDRCANEVSRDGELIYSHNIPSSVDVVDENGEYYEIIGFEYDQLCGCGCPCGVRITIRKE